MDIVRNYIYETLSNIKDIAKKKGHLRTANYLDELIHKKAKMFHFSANGLYEEGTYNTTIKLLGEGCVTIICEDVLENRELLPNKYTEIKIQFKDKKLRDYFIYGVNNIAELDVSSNEVHECNFDVENKINKLVIYNNNIQKLNCSQFKELQFLHMFNNPICKKLEEMKNVISGLPNRNGKPFGSIIMYDWVNLGFCGHYYNGQFYYDKEHKYPFENNLYENEVYRDTDSIDKPWYKYSKNEDEEQFSFKELSEYNDLIMIRRQLEGLNTNTNKYEDKKGSIFKNWVFGSAIQYNEDAWKCCDFPFKNAHIADVWETAEKGEGVGITSMDMTMFLHPSMNNSNIYAYSYIGYPTASYDVNGGIYPVNRYESPDNIAQVIKTSFPWIEKGCYLVPRKTVTSTNKLGDVSSHGDNCFSLMGDRGTTKICESIYGIAPESRYYLLSLEKGSGGALLTHSTWNDYLRMVCEATSYESSDISFNADTSPSSDISSISTNDMNILTRSLATLDEIPSNPTDNDSFRNKICSEMFKHIVALNAQGNNGEGFPWTSDQGTTDSNGVEYKAQYDNYSLGKECYFVSSMNNNKQISTYSSNDRTDKPHTYNYSCYGEGLRRLSPVDRTILCGSGASYATPLHAAETALLMVIFAKLKEFYKFDSIKNYWYVENSEDNKEDFISYLNQHLDKLQDEGRYATGNGTIDMLCYNDSNTPETAFTCTLIKNKPLDIYSINKLNQITDCGTGKVFLNQGHYAKANINDIVFTDRQHSSFMVLRKPSINPTITVYNDNLNIIESADAYYGITDDMSKNVWYSTAELDISGIITDISPVTEGRLCELEPKDIQNINTTIKDCKYVDGWTLNSVLRYNRSTVSDSETCIYDSPNFSVNIKVKSSGSTITELSYAALRFISKKGIFKDNGGLYTDGESIYVAFDYFKNGDSTYRGTGYLGMLNGNDFVFTIVKRANCNIFDFYLNGQYIISHNDSYNHNIDTIESLSILPPDINNQNSTHISNVKCVNMYDRSLTDEEVAQEVAYLHKTYIKEKT